MNLPWFRRIGIFFIPAAFIGWVILIAALVYAVYTFRDIDSTSHSVSDTLMIFAFQALIIAVVYSVIAYFTSESGKS